MNKCVCFLYISITLIVRISPIGRLQSTAVKGVLLCKGHPAKGVHVKLYDDDRDKRIFIIPIFEGPDLDDLMDEGYTDADGKFELSGSVEEVTTIDPKLNPCQRKFSVMIPDKYVSIGKTPKEVFDAGRIELQGELKGESRDCLNRFLQA